MAHRSKLPRPSRSSCNPCSTSTKHARASQMGEFYIWLLEAKLLFSSWCRCMTLRWTSVLGSPARANTLCLLVYIALWNGATHAHSLRGGDVSMSSDNAITIFLQLLDSSSPPWRDPSLVVPSMEMGASYSEVIFPRANSTPQPSRTISLAYDPRLGLSWCMAIYFNVSY